MAEGIMDIDDSTFETEVLQSEKPVLVDFWAPWCGPCKAIAPIVDELSRDYAGKLKFTKFNVDESPITPGKYGIRAIPTLMIFKGGDIAEQITGMVAKNKLEESLKKAL